jgi:hypothetical protein
MFKFFKKNTKESPSLQKESNEKGDGHFHAVTVKEVRRETEEAVSIAFNLPRMAQIFHSYQDSTSP